ncbi:CDP-glucose 4,6-dehydratase [Lachnospiraceae bacterium G41]|nr:CDP-glucose 4,6-dehydratase [Lachnospiraceae bacterium G41]
MDIEKLKSFYKNKKVLITGHTGFKGSWICLLLESLDADVYGYSLNAPTNPSLFELCDIKSMITHFTGDVRDLDTLKYVFNQVKPEIVIHMAAQPIVRDSYKEPVYTYDVNVMGTVNVLECVRLTDSVKSFVNVTTDKVYLNRELNESFKENEELCGFDPYSNSKSCSELVTYSYKNSFFGGESGQMSDGRIVSISTCRAGNVIGGGDFANDRIIPDCVRAIEAGKDIIVRNPFSIRPYQHVLEPLFVYLSVAMEQFNNPSFAGAYNVGPNDCDCITTGDMVTKFCDKWNKYQSNKDNCKMKELCWKNLSDNGPHEAAFLKLDSSKVRNALSWTPRWSINEALDKIIEWTDVYLGGGDVRDFSLKQIKEFITKE